jgi:hypothetical protein
VAGTLVSAGLLLGSVGGAQARPRYGWDRGWDRHHRRGDGFGVGDAIGVAAIIGAVAIVASSVAKDKAAGRAPVDGDDAPPPRAGTDYGADVPDVPTDEGATDDAMADACALAARDEAQRRGGYAEVRHVDPPQATAGGYNIDGDVEVRASFRATGGVTHRFTCAMQGDRVTNVYLSRDVATR